MDQTLPAFIDAHHHLWDLEACHYPWLMDRGQKRFFGDPTPIQQNYLVADFLSESDTYRPVKSVHIQVGVAPEDNVAETRWLQAQEAYPHAIVAASDLTSPGFARELEEQLAYSRTRGIRQIVGRHTEEDKKHGSDALLEDPAFLEGLKQLARLKLSFDLQMVPPQMEKVLRLLKQVPDLKVVLCHCGSPWDQTPEGLRQWRSGLEQFAELPNSYCKVSGLGMFNHSWQKEELQPIIHNVIDVFGCNRVMFGSNFPVDKLYNSYEALWSAYSAATSGYSDTECQSMFHDTAATFYRI